MLQALPLGASLSQQLIPVIRRKAIFQHLAEHLIGVVTAFVSAPGVLIVDPREYDYLAKCVVAKEQTILLKEFRPEPVLVIVAKGAPWRYLAGLDLAG